MDSVYTLKMIFELPLRDEKEKSFTLCQYLVRYSSDWRNVLDFFSQCSFPLCNICTNQLEILKRCIQHMMRI
jgi:hypothetical protein